MIHRFTVVVVAFAFCLAAESAVAENAINETQAAAIEMVNSAYRADGGSGIQVAVIKDGHLAFSYAVGHADLENDVPLEPGTRMRIGSVSKVFTTTLVAALVQKEMIRLDTDIREYVPEFPEKGSTITARQIASHTSGLRHYDFSNMAEANNMRFYEALSDALPVFAEDPLLSEPGTEHHYSGFGINLLGVAVERVVGLPYSQALIENLLLPLDLTNTMVDHPLAIIPGRTRFYTVLSGQLVNTFWRDSSDYYPSGGLLSTAEDIASFTHAIFESDFLDEERQTLMRTESTTADQQAVGYTFGWQVMDNESGKLMYFHGGETNGAYCNVLFIPEDGLIVAGIANYNVFPSDGEVAFFDLVRRQLPELL